MPEKMEIIIQVLNNKLVGGPVDENIEIEARKRASKFRDVRNDIGVIQILGTITNRASAFQCWSGGTSTMAIGSMLDQAVADPTIGAIILDVDSPGGSVAGVTELSSKIFNARGKKPIIAISNSLMASAAFWIASAADEIVVTPSADIGSVGVIGVHTDTSEADEKAGIKTTFVTAGKFKGEGAMPLTDEGLSAMQERVNEFHDMFVTDLARNRGVSENKVRNDFGQGRVMGASAAIANKLADRIGTFEQVVEDIQKPSKRRNTRAQLDLIKLR
jgi:signal peptide peptidase SppA